MAATWGNPKVKDPTVRDRIMLYVCTYAKENNGVTPTVRQIARYFNRHLSTIQTHMQKLVDEERLYWIEEQSRDDEPEYYDKKRRTHLRYRVERSKWQEPEDIEL